MKELNEQEESVGRYYDEVIFDAEIARLKTLFPVEYAITARHLRRWIADGASVAEIGVGGGEYSELLAARGCRSCAMGTLTPKSRRQSAIPI